MKELVTGIEELKDTEVEEKVQERIAEFKRIGECGNERWFSELSFCVLTANSSAQLGIDIQEELGTEGFIESSLSELQERLNELGHRFYRTRAEYIVENRKYSDCVKDIVNDFSDPKNARQWLVDNVKGIGYKEGSHFLRNVGYESLMILDRHILRIIDEGGLIPAVPETLTRKRYMSIEKEVLKLANEVQLSLGEIDLYLWYMETGEILK